VARIKVQVACRSETVGDAVARKLRDHGRFDVNVRVAVNGHADPLHDLPSRPDLLVLHYVAGCGELEHLASLGPQQRVPLLVFGPADDAQAMRLAMRAGASDYLPEPLIERDLLGSIDRVCDELSRKPSGGGTLLTVINSKGGAGASFVASNLGCAFAEKGVTALADLDFQFGCQARYLDVQPERGILEALEAIGDLDKAAVEAFVTVHRSGLKLLAAPVERPFAQPVVTPEMIDTLLHVFLEHCQYVVADLPHHIDGVSAGVLARSDRVLLVVQQSIAHANGAARLMQVMREDIGIRDDCIDVVVNRFTKNSLIELGDIRKTLRVESVHVIPNQYKVVSDSLDSGHPALLGARSSAVAKALRELAKHYTGSPDDERKSGFLGRALPNFLGAN
jgi:pilus assembly protein CpaE